MFRQFALIPTDIFSSVVHANHPRFSLHPRRRLRPQFLTRPQSPRRLRRAYLSSVSQHFLQVPQSFLFLPCSSPRVFQLVIRTRTVTMLTTLQPHPSLHTPATVQRREAVANRMKIQEAANLLSITRNTTRMETSKSTGLAKTLLPVIVRNSLAAAELT